MSTKTPNNTKGPEIEVSTPKKTAFERMHETSISMNVPFDESLILANGFDESREAPSTDAIIIPKPGNDETNNNHVEFRAASSSSNAAGRETSSMEETEEERARREEEESIALAQQLMAEEAMAVSYHMSMDYLRHNRDQFSEEDLAALQAAMDDDEEEDDEEEEPGADTSGDSMSYELMLRLGERLGDVKSERWARIAQEKIACLPTMRFDPKSAQGKDDNDCDAKCLVCQFAYEKDDVLRRLPCGHCFHADCVDQWLQTKDHCPYCRTGIADS